MKYFRFLIRTDDQDTYQALVISAETLEQAIQDAKSNLRDEEKLVSINVLQEDKWVLIKGTALKGKTVKEHPNNQLNVSVLGDAFTREEIQQMQTNNQETSSQPATKPQAAPKASPESPTVFKLLLQACWATFSVCILRMFTIPFSIWKGSMMRMAGMSKSKSDQQAASDTEFPVFEWLKFTWDGVIFSSWFLGSLTTIILILNAGYGDSEWGIFFSGLFMTYFGVIGLSLIKESLILALSIALNVEKISNKNASAQES